jgi:hypothetical protein
MSAVPLRDFKFMLGTEISRQLGLSDEEGRIAGSEIALVLYANGYVMSNPALTRDPRPAKVSDDPVTIEFDRAQPSPVDIDLIYAELRSAGARIDNLTANIESRDRTINDRLDHLGDRVTKLDGS